MGGRGMPNRVYQDLNKLRTETNGLIDRGGVRVHRHARIQHPELSELEQIAVVRYGGAIKFDEKRPQSDGVYVCWSRLPGPGLCRGVFSIVEGLNGDLVLVITAFQEQWK
jgi:hypothetical protein